MLISLFLFLDSGTQGIPRWSSGQDSGLPLWEAWLLSHVRKLRSYKPLDATKENKKQGGNRLSLKKSLFITISLQKIYLLLDCWFPNILANWFGFIVK